MTDLALQALFNIAKVARTFILRYFNDIFDGICKLVADMDPEVKTGAGVLNRKMKDIVTGACNCVRTLPPLLAPCARVGLCRRTAVRVRGV